MQGHGPHRVVSPTEARRSLLALAGTLAAALSLAGCGEPHERVPLDPGLAALAATAPMLVLKEDPACLVSFGEATCWVVEDRTGGDRSEVDDIVLRRSFIRID